jgi:hypothetical protein
MRSSKTGWVSGTISATVVALGAAGCATSTGFQSTWRNPEISAVRLEGQKVIALVISTQETTRRSAEDQVAAQITARGAQGIASWTILPTADMQNEERARAALTKAGAVAVVSMEIVDRIREASRSPNFHMTMSHSSRGSFWGNYRWAWGNTWHSGPPPTTTVWVETLLYSLEPDKLLWGGRSRTVNPSDVNDVFAEVAVAAAREIDRAGLVKGPVK